MPGPYGLIPFVMLSIVATLAAMMLLIQPTVAEMDVGLDWRRGGDVVSCKDPSGGSLCLCAIVAGHGSDDEVKLYDFLREGGNRCELRSQEEHSYEYGDCIIHLYTFFTASERPLGTPQLRCLPVKQQSL